MDIHVRHVQLLKSGRRILRFVFVLIVKFGMELNVLVVITEEYMILTRNLVFVLQDRNGQEVYALKTVSMVKCGTLIF
jgi:hypothetical protein